MNLSGIAHILQRLPAYADILTGLENSADLPPQAVLGSARPLLIAGLALHRPGPVLVITEQPERAYQLAEQIAQFLPPQDTDAGDAPLVHVFPEPDALAYERIFWADVTVQRRLTALALLMRPPQAPATVVVTSARALMQKTLPPKELRMAMRPISVGDTVVMDTLTGEWVASGYNPVEVVEEPGTFARRGGIIDIWPPNLSQPIRIDLFGDDVDSLRVFDPATQRTISRIPRAQIGPGSETLAKHGPRALARNDGELTRLLADPALVLGIREEIRLEIELLQQGHSFRGIHWYLPYFYAQPGCLLDYLPATATLLVEDGADLGLSMDQIEVQAATLHDQLVRAGELPDGFATSLFSPMEIKQRLLDRRPLILGTGDLMGKHQSANTGLARCFVPGPRYGGKTKQILADIVGQRDDGHITILVTRQAARMAEGLADHEITAHVQHELTTRPPHGVTLIQGVLREGFVVRGIEDFGLGISDFGLVRDDQGSTSATPIQNPKSKIQNLHLLSDTELFGWNKPAARKRKTGGSRVAPELFFADVKAGEFVVHMEHGIGIYDGLVQLELSGIQREYLQVSYALGDKLYVPVHQADRLSRFVGGDASPLVSRLGTADWQTVKERAKKAVADIADDLLELYAQRELVSGHAFSPDSLWQEELEESFPYQETEDQLQAIQDVKVDMESDQPMDRLICGDVGYGKTEVAIRAAFKAITDGKQVAVLVPTTVLAAQHFRTFSRRLAPFPVRVEMLSRFRTHHQQEKVIKGLLTGEVDLVIGTHRLLSQDITFKDLGLLVIDEEQRFGVSHKELLKQLRSMVDVLTLSATPIPRTLHMSLSGIRDMSTINTPPQERLPVHTVLSEYDEVLVRQSIQREMDRGGQVFFVHNRVRGIQAIAARLQRLLPDVRVDVGHGQMAERGLEEVMMRFADGEVDVLVSTTIIENGLDIPNANTIIINRADHFGLAQLYQLRGRVGRSAQRGYCYLLYDKFKDLTFDARRRLSAVVESSEELGAGFRIAMRDLEIRGAGELLGAKQHGQIATVGFDLYTRLLAQAINEAKRKKEVFEREAGRSGEQGSESGGEEEKGRQEEKEVGPQRTNQSINQSPVPAQPLQPGRSPRPARGAGSAPGGRDPRRLRGRRGAAPATLSAHRRYHSGRGTDRNAPGTAGSLRLRRPQASGPALGDRESLLPDPGQVWRAQGQGAQDWPPPGADRHHARQHGERALRHPAQGAPDPTPNPPGPSPGRG